VPLNIQDLKYLNSVRSWVIDNPIPIPNLESILLCDDKYLFNQKLIEKGFGYLIPKINGKQTYPYILKKGIDSWGKESHLIYNAQIEQTFSDKLADPKYFSQQFIIGSQEYATHIIFKDSKIVCSLTFEYNFKIETPIKGKDESIDKRICLCPYLEEFASVLTLIDFNGLCCINYKVYENRLFIMEINPRFGGSLCSYFSFFIIHL
jgi:carbamoylphosphate synthase large subunit